MPGFRLPYVLVTALYCAFIFVLSAQSDPPGADLGIPGLDKLAHAVLYAGLAAVVAVGIRRSNAAPRPALLFVVPVLFAVAYGLSDEIHQIYVPHRDFEWADLLADAVGATVAQTGLCLYWFLRPRVSDG